MIVFITGTELPETGIRSKLKIISYSHSEGVVKQLQLYTYGKLQLWSLLQKTRKE